MSQESRDQSFRGLEESERERIQRILEERSRPLDPKKLDELARASEKFRELALKERRRRERTQFITMAAILGILALLWRWLS
ncbi:hypothetical protein V8F20_007109 [Naviculisporaceae sp. PSN 640]